MLARKQEATQRQWNDQLLFNSELFLWPTLPRRPMRVGEGGPTENGVTSLGGCDPTLTNSNCPAT